MRFVKKFFSFTLLISFFSISATSLVQAETLPFEIRQAVVWVHCGNRQGSGVIIHDQPGYVLTNAHILLDLKTMQPDACEIALVNGETLKPALFYEANWERYVMDDTQNQDFAILKIGSPKQATSLPAFPILKTDEFSKVNDPIAVLGFPNKANGAQSLTSGVIQGLEQGIIKTDAEISPGSSGGAGIDQNNHLTGIATRILFREISPGVEELVDYELVDLRAVITWLDTFGTNTHDQYLVHADMDRFHGPSSYYSPGDLNCQSVVKTTITSTVYCLHGDGTRQAFPNDETYHSWIADFFGVKMMTPENLAMYRLTSMVTMKPGTLIKIPTDPKVYLVSDTTGTIRWVKTEDVAKKLYGDGWAGFVKDVPIEFFAIYHVGTEIE